MSKDELQDLKDRQADLNPTKGGVAAPQRWRCGTRTGSGTANFSSFVIMFGAAINAQSGKQTRKDSTAGDPEDMGRCGARAADTLGETR
jgi:hypothetical protein